MRHGLGYQAANSAILRDNDQDLVSESTDKYFSVVAVNGARGLLILYRKSRFFDLHGTRRRAEAGYARVCVRALLSEFLSGSMLYHTLLKSE